MSTTPAEAWQDYQAATRQLGDVRRQAAALAAERHRAAGVVRQELDTAYRRVLLQRSQLVDSATRSGVPVPSLAPVPAEVAEAMATMTAAVADARVTVAAGPAAGPAGGPGGGPAPAAQPGGGFATGRAVAPGMISAALRNASVTLDTADATLFATGQAWGQRGEPTRRRNAAVYAGYAILLAVAQSPFVFALMRERASGVFALCGLVFPPIAFALGWLTVGVAFRAAPGGGRVDRTPALGILISLVAAAPIALVLLLAAVTALAG